MHANYFLGDLHENPEECHINLAIILVLFLYVKHLNYEIVLKLHSNTGLAAHLR